MGDITREDIEDAWATARRSLEWSDFQKLLDAGVSRHITRHLPSDSGLAFGAADIAVRGKSWEMRFQGDRAIILPVWGLDPEQTNEFAIEAAWAVESLENTRDWLNGVREKTKSQEIIGHCDAILINIPKLLERAERRAEKIARKAMMYPVNLVAFRIDTPRSFWLLDPDAHSPFLGEENIERAAFIGEPIEIHETPLDWLRADCAGCVILDWRHFWPAYFANIPALRVADLNFGRRLTAHLERPFAIPDVQVAV